MHHNRQHIAIVAALLASLQLAAAQSTAFTYQGQLNDSGHPASGTCDLRFAVFKAGTNGVPVGGPLTNSGPQVTLQSVG